MHKGRNGHFSASSEEQFLPSYSRSCLIAAHSRFSKFAPGDLRSLETFLNICRRRTGEPEMAFELCLKCVFATLSIGKIKTILLKQNNIEYRKH